MYLCGTRVSRPFRARWPKLSTHKERRVIERAGEQAGGRAGEVDVRSHVGNRGGSEDRRAEVLCPWGWERRTSPTRPRRFFVCRSSDPLSPVPRSARRRRLSSLPARFTLLWPCLARPGPVSGHPHTARAHGNISILHARCGLGRARPLISLREQIAASLREGNVPMRARRGVCATLSQSVMTLRDRLARLQGRSTQPRTLAQLATGVRLGQRFTVDRPPAHPYHEACCLIVLLGTYRPPSYPRRLSPVWATCCGTTNLVKPAREDPCGTGTTSLYSPPYIRGEEGIKERLSLIAT